MQTFLAAFTSCLTAALILAPQAGFGKPFTSKRPVRAVVVGGSISMYYKGNYGEYLEHGCKNLEIVNRAKVGAGGRALVKRLRNAVLGDKDLMDELVGKHKQRESWLIFQGGLNSAFSPEMTNSYLAQMFKLAADSGMSTFALTLTPWGKDDNDRFDGWEGLRFVRATKKINAFLQGKLSPDQALGRRGKGHAHEWQKGELPMTTVDVFNSELRDADAPLRDAAPLQKSFAKSRFRKQKAKRDALVQEAREVPRHFMKKSYQDFDHIHPKNIGHRLMATLACRKAPKSWGCDCDKIARATWHKGKVRGK